MRSDAITIGGLRRPVRGDGWIRKLQRLPKGKVAEIHDALSLGDVVGALTALLVAGARNSQRSQQEIAFPFKLTA